MAIEILPHNEKYTKAVEAFNNRMRIGGSKWGFYTDPTPDWIPYAKDAKTWREYRLAVETDQEIVRGGYALKPQQWLINGNLEWVTDWQGPFTEAAIDVKYSPLMLKLFRTMLKDHPLLFSLGHGGTEEPIVDLLAKMNWELIGVPFTFRVLKPFRFARKNGYLRTSRLRRWLLDVLAFSGLASLGLRSLHLRLRRQPYTRGLKIEVVDNFGQWTDKIWETEKEKYRCLAVRDSQMMNTLMPATGWPGGTRLKISRFDEVIGWAIVNDKQMVDDPRFGSLHVGLITDCFSSPDNATAVIRAAHDYLASQNIDMVFANLSHPKWIQATRDCGYIVLEDRRLFAVSPALRDRLEPYEEVSKGLHLTNMDGHGPHGFQ